MKTFTTKIGQIFEIWESRKEALNYVIDTIDSLRYCNKIGQSSDESIFIKYKDGTYFAIGDDYEEGKFKKTNIETVIDCNPGTFMIFGKYKIYNIDDIDEEYTQENDTEDKFWNVDTI